MSELTQCNYCTLRAIRLRSEKDKKEFEVKTKPDGSAEVRINGKVVAWMAALTDHCVC